MISAKKNSFITGRMAFFIAIVLFRAMLDYAYVGFLNVIYEKSYLSFKYNFELSQYLLSWLIFISAIPLTNRFLDKFSDFFFLSAVLALLGPLTSLYGLDANRPIFPLLLTFGSVLVVYWVATSRVLKVPYIPNFKKSRTLLISLSWGLVGFLIFWFFISGGVANINFDPAKVYDFREATSEMIDVGFMAYLNLWIYKFFTIFLICYSLDKKRYMTVVLLLAIHIFIYGVTAHKIVFFLPFLAISVWFYFRRTKSLIILPFGYFMVILLAYSIYVIFEYDLIATLMVRRVFYVPAALTFEWIDFFSSRQHVYWSNNVLSMFIQYPYYHDIPRTVGAHLLTPELGANNGYVSSGFAHAGVFGVLIYSVLLGYLIRMLDVFARRGVQLWFVLALTAGPLRTILTDSDLLTALLSHGLLVAMLIILLYRSGPNVQHKQSDEHKHLSEANG